MLLLAAHDAHLIVLPEPEDAEYPRVLTRAEWLKSADASLAVGAQNGLDQQSDGYYLVRFYTGRAVELTVRAVDCRHPFSQWLAQVSCALPIDFGFQF